jgi:multidrug transporter EmrE-like cation transporter
MRLPSRRFLLLQGGYFVFSLSGVFLKTGSNLSVLSSGFLLRYGASLLCVFFFALIWQQVLREYELMTAYAWRGVLFLWTFLWAVLFFGESVTLNNVIGAAVILFGVILVSRSE